MDRILVLFIISAQQFIIIPLYSRPRTSDRENPQIDSVSDIWETANLHEREVYDLLGIKFTNHPDLRRLFLDSSWGFPLEERLC